MVSGEWVDKKLGVRPWWRVMGRVLAITTILALYLVILWPVLWLAWQYWSRVAFRN